MSSIADKLKFKDGMKALIVNAPDGYLTMLNDGMNDSTVDETARESIKYHFVQLFANDSSDLESHFPRLAESLEPSGLLWICYRKKSKDPTNELTSDDGWYAVTQEGYRPVAIVVMDDLWAAVRWKKTEEVRPKIKFEFPEIDYVNRTVQPPDDFVRILKDTGLHAKFLGMSFTHKKEYVEAIVSAIKPTTRTRRIEKMILLLRKSK